MEWQSITAFIPDLSFQTASQVHTESDSTADHDHGQLELFVDYGSAGTTVPEPFGGMHPTDSLQLSSTSEQMQDIRHTLNQDHFSGWLGGFPPEMAIENPSIDLDPAIEQINVPLSQPSAWQSPASDMCPNCQTSTLGLPFRNLANTFYGSQNLHANISIGSTDSSQIMLSNIFPDSNVSGPKLLSLDAPGGIELGDPITNSMSALGLDGFENPAAALEFSSVLLGTGGELFAGISLSPDPIWSWNSGFPPSNSFDTSVHSIQHSQTGHEYAIQHENAVGRWCGNFRKRGQSSEDKSDHLPRLQPKGDSTLVSIHLVPKKRKRVNIKPPGANNRVGRKGVQACEQCRKRNTKCIYSIEWLPCNFCRSKDIKIPCVKIWGPKKSARLTPSRPLPTAIEGTLSAEDALLLTYAYSNPTRFDEINTYFRLFATEYTPAITVTSLRYAILARTALSLRNRSSEMKQKAQYYNNLSWAAVGKVQSTGGDTEADIFALQILACVAWDTEEDRVATVRKCKSLIVGFFDNDSQANQPGRMVSTLLPSILDELDYCDMLATSLTLKSQTWLLDSFVTFKSYAAACEMVDNFECNYPKPRLCTVQNFLAIAFKRLICCLLRWTITEARISIQNNERLLLFLAVADVKDRLEEEYFQRELTSLLSEAERRDRGESLEDTFAAELSIYAAQTWNAIQLAFLMLESPTVMDGLHSPKAKCLSKTLLSSLQKNSPLSTRVLASCTLYSYIALLVLPSLVTDREEVINLKPWLSKELEAMKMVSVMEELEKYWTEGKDIIKVAYVLSEVVYQWSIE